MVSPGGRDLRIDFLRGAVIFAMVVDHVGGDKSWLYPITGGDRFYISAAEGFVFLSGVVCGMVYGPRAASRGWVAGGKLLKRAGIIYLWTMALTLTAPFVASALQLGWDDPLQRYAPWEFVVRVLTLHLTYHLTDVLLLYVLLFGVAGAIIVWMVDGYTRWLLLVSWATWALWQTATDYPAPWDIQAMTVFQFAAWQALFVTGLAIGIHREKLARFGERGARVCLLVGGLGFGAAIASYQLRVVNKNFGAGGASHIVSKSDLGIGRLIVFLFLALFAIGLVNVAWKPLNRALGWLLIPLGQNSLAAYILHVGVVIAVTEIGLFAIGRASRTAGQNTLLELTGVFMVWGLVLGLAKLRELRKLAGGAYRDGRLARIVPVRIKPV
jgi:hypothetical protein